MPLVLLEYRHRDRRGAHRGQLVVKMRIIRVLTTRHLVTTAAITSAAIAHIAAVLQRHTRHRLGHLSLVGALRVQQACRRAIRVIVAVLVVAVQGVSKRACRIVRVRQVVVVVLTPSHLEVV